MDPYVLAVGASDGKDSLAGWAYPSVASFSSSGNAARHVDLVAPGRSLVSLRDPGSYVDVALGVAGAAERGDARVGPAAAETLPSEAPTASTYGSIAGSVRRPADGALVAAGDDHDDAVLPGVLDGRGQRVGLVGLHRVGAEGEVDDTDPGAVGGRRVLRDPVEAGDDLADVGAAVGRRELERLESASGATPSCTDGLSVAIPARVRVDRVVCGDDAREMRAVTVGVLVDQVGAVRLDRQVRAVVQLVRAVQAGDLGRAGVEQGDADALAGDLRCAASAGSQTARAPIAFSIVYSEPGSWAAW